MYVAAFIPIFIILLSSEYRVNIEVEGGVEGAILNDFLGGIDGGGCRPG